MEKIKRKLDRRILDVVSSLEMLKYSISLLEMESSVLTTGGKNLPDKSELINNVKAHYDEVLKQLKEMDLDLNGSLTKELRFVAIVTGTFADEHKLSSAQIFEWSSDVECYVLSTRGPNDPQTIATVQARIRRWKEGNFTDVPLVTKGRS